MSHLKTAKDFFREKRLNYLFFFAILVTTGALLPQKFSVTLTPSTKYRVFYLNRYPSGAGKGDYVLLEISTPLLKDGKPFEVVKRVACAKGDTLAVINKEYFCNGQNLGKAKEYSLKGEKLKNFSFFGEIPENMIFVSGSHIDSYDSRYFGFLNVEKVKAIAHPIF